MRLIVTFLLSFVFLFVKGNAHQYHPAYNNKITYAALHLSPTATPSVLSFERKTGAILQKDVADNAASDPVNATEVDEDDDDSISSRKLVEITNYFISFLYDHLFADYHRYKKERLPFCKHFSYSSSFKYIIQRVIRI